MDDTKKCSSKNHEKYDAIIYCQNCNIYLCNKCSKIHSEWFQTHNIIDLNKKKDEIFTIYCQKKYHSNILEFFCKTHNVLCCAACISKINDKKYGQHSDCNVCSIEEIKEDKKSELNDNIEKLKELLNNFEKILLLMDELFQKANEDKEKLKMEVQRIFTVIRNEVNKREDKILSDIDEIFEQKFFKSEALIKENKKLPKKAKKCLEKGKIIEKENKWDMENNNLISNINDCIDIEKNISNIEQIKEKFEDLSSNMVQIKFVPFLKDSLDDLIEPELNYSDKDEEDKEKEDEDKDKENKVEKDSDKENKEEKDKDKEEIHKNNDNEEDNEMETIKIIFLGDEKVGKSSMFNRLYKNTFEEDYQATIGLDFHSKRVKTKNWQPNLIFYDTSGQQKFKSLIPMYIKDSQVIIFVYDISNKDSFIHIENWYNDLKDLIKEDAILILIGNKTDLEEKRQITTKEVEDYSKQKGFLFYELSSKAGDKINDLLGNIILPEISKKFLTKINKDFINKNDEGNNEIKKEKDYNQNNIQINEEKKNNVISNRDDLEEEEKDKIKIDIKKEMSNMNLIKINKKENNIKLNEYLKIIKAFGHLESKILFKKDYKILLLGLDDSGKTTILYQLKSGETVKTIPTIGFNVETLDYEEANLTIWDVGGSDKMRVLWKHYFQNTDGLIYVVHSSDRDRMDESSEELKNILAEEELKGCPILIFANKQDLNGALAPGEITDKFNMGQIRSRKWLVSGASGKTGQGLKEGLSWLTENLIDRKNV